MDIQSIKDHAKKLGYEFDDEDCQEILDTTYEGETVAEAVEDFLSAFER
jgi:hypothetical protein